MILQFSFIYPQQNFENNDLNMQGLFYKRKKLLLFDICDTITDLKNIYTHLKVTNCKVHKKKFIQQKDLKYHCIEKHKRKNCRVIMKYFLFKKIE